MALSTETIKKQVIATLGLAARNLQGVPAYTTALGDNTYATEEIDRAILDGLTDIMRAITTTDGHHHRALFTVATPVQNAVVLPSNSSGHGVPRITPFEGAGFTIVGKRRSIEEIQAYRENPGKIYSATEHDEAADGRQSRLAGYYAIDRAANVIYFTGHTAVIDIAKFTEASINVLPDTYHGLGTALAIKHLKKDGDVSDVFDHYTRIADEGLALIRSRSEDQPGTRKTTGARDTGTK